jgi:hypothetical protein
MRELGLNFFVKSKVVIQKKGQKIAIVIGLALGLEQSAHHGSAVRLDNQIPMMAILLWCPATLMRVVA